jgi:hypothetical protein
VEDAVSDAELPIWVVYDHPRDWPACWVARKWIGEAATDAVIVAPTLELLHKWLADMRLVRLSRDPEDDPKIMEVWL